MLRIAAFILGLVFLASGLAMYVPALMQDGLLLGIFEMDATHCLIHIVSGIIAILASTRADYSRLFLKVFGILYALVAIAGFLTGGDLVIMHVNQADNILHIIIAILALYMGFGYGVLPL